MAIDFSAAGNTFIDHGTGANYPGGSGGKCTYMFIGKAHDASGTNNRILYISGGGQVFVGLVAGVNGGCRMIRPYSGTSSDVQIVQRWADNDIVFIAMVDRGPGVDPEGWLRVNGGALTDFSDTPVQPTGTATDPTTGVVEIGGRNNATGSSQWEVQHAWIYGRDLSRNEIAAHAADVSTRLDSLELCVNYVDKSAFGLRDWSGNGRDGTANGTNAVISPPPYYGYQWDFDEEVGVYIPAAAAPAAAVPSGWMSLHPHLQSRRG